MFWHTRRFDDRRALQPALTVDEQRSFWQQSLDRLAEYLQTLKPAKRNGAANNHKEN